MADFLLKNWLTAQGLQPDLVVGHIRWPRTLGRPASPMDQAFEISCFHYDYQTLHDIHPNSAAEHVLSPHLPVVHWEGPHDGQYYRVSFITDSRQPKHYPEDSPDPRRYQNFVKVRIKEGVLWLHDIPQLEHSHEMVPAQLAFVFPNKAIVLPDFEVRQVRNDIQRKHHMYKKSDRPQSESELLELDDKACAHDTRPWGVVTESSMACFAERGTSIEVERSKLMPNAYVLKSSSAINFGLPVLESRSSPVRRRSMTERLAAAKTRHLDHVDRASRSSRILGEPHCPDGVPTGFHPKSVTAIDAQRIGITSRGTKTLLSADHSTIINGESREFVYPDRYPYTAVCKLYVSYQPSPGAPWRSASEATGYLIGKSTLMTSGHVHPPANSAWQIKVVPACWAGRSVFGIGFVTYVRSTTWWDSDAGSDIMVCQLYDPVGERTGYFGYRGYDSAWEDGAYWYMAGYPYDRSLTSMSRQIGIAVRDDDDGDDIEVNGEDYDTTQVESDADEASGASGSPLWGNWSGMPYAIGVHHGAEHDGTISGTQILSCASGGAGFTAAAHWARSMWT